MATDRARGRPTKIGLDEIIDAAVAVGGEHASMRAVARHLGVGASTLYYHVESREELQALVADRTLEQLRLHLEVPSSWPEAAYRAAYGLRALFEQQPGLAHRALSSPLWGETTRRINEEACQFLSQAGFPPDTAWLAVRAIADFVEGYVVRAEAHTAAGQTDLDSIDDGFEPCPAMAAARERLGTQAMEQRFEFGLRCVIEGLIVLSKEGSSRS